MAQVETNKLYTDLTISSEKSSSLKAYYKSIKRTTKPYWKLLRDESYQDRDTFEILLDHFCLQARPVIDKKAHQVIHAKIYVGLTDSAIHVLRIDLTPTLTDDLELYLQCRGYFLREFHQLFLEPSKYYQLFNHRFEFRGHIDEHWLKLDIRDSRRIRLRSKADDKTYELSRTNFVEISGQQMHFPNPNNISLALSVMKKSFKEAFSIHKKILNIGRENSLSIPAEKQSLLYDYFESTLTAIIFAYTAVEAMTNAIIPENFEFVRLNEKGIKEVWNKDNVERWMSTSDKLKYVMPKIFPSAQVTMENYWPRFKELEDIRNMIIHQKTRDSHTVLDTEIHKQLLLPSVFTKIKSAIAIIKYFYQFDDSHPSFPLGLGRANYKIEEVDNIEDRLTAFE